jgi:hypothetical protein
MILVAWVGLIGWHGYVALRLVVTGLDYLALSLTLFGLAVLISLGKGGLLPAWVFPREVKAAEPTEAGRGP